MALSGSQTTKISAGGSGKAYAGFIAKAEAVVILYVTCNLVDRNGSEQVSLTDLDWAWFDSIDPATFIAPTDQGAIESTDGTGTISVDLPNTTLTTGQDGTLILSNGIAYGAYRLTTV